MEAGFIALLLVSALVVGIVAGIFIGRSTKCTSGTQGVVYADCSDPYMGPSLLLDPKVPIADIVSRKQVTFDVHVIQ